MTSSVRTSTSACWPGIPSTSSDSTCPATSSATTPDDRYRRVARTLAAWRSDGTLHKDPHPSIYVYEQTYRVPGTDVDRTQRGFFARLRLEAFGPTSGVLPHERTLAAAREDRYKLLRATGVNTSPVIVLYDDPGTVGRPVLDALTGGAPAADIVDDDGVRHRLWAVAADGDAAAELAPLISVAAAGTVVIADGHHRYETALRYRDERRMSRSCEEDPAFDYLLTLFVDAAGEQLTILPTHRLLRGLGDDGVVTAPREPRRPVRGPSRRRTRRARRAFRGRRSRTRWRPGSSDSGRARAGHC